MALKAKKSPTLIIIVVASLALILGVIFLNDVTITIRLVELKGFLREINREASKIDQIGMISKYKLHKELYENKISEEKRDEEELKTAYLITSFEKQTQITIQKYKYVSKPILWVMNFFRFFLSKPPVESVLSDPLVNELTVAYYLERNKEYEEAMKKYEEILEKNSSGTEHLPNILLHQGFCLSVLGEYDEAKEKYISIIKEYNNEETSIIAAQLLNILREFEDEVEKIKKSDENMLVKSEKLYKLIAYKDALEVLENIPVEDEKDRAKIQYLTARCNEETGKKKESAKIYQDIINTDQNSELAKLSNRRILVIASVDEKLEKLKDLAKKNNELIKDESFAELTKTAERIEPVLKPEIMEAVTKPQKTLEQPGSPEPESIPFEEDFDKFLEVSIETIEIKIKIEQAVVMTTPVPTSTSTYAPKPEYEFPATPVAGRTEAPIQTPEPTPVPRGKVFRKDNLGRIYRTDIFDEEGRGELLRYYIYKYDEKGKPVSNQGYLPDGTLLDE